ncbi:MAG: hypothetical protein ACMUIU_12890 [bacterium]
MADKHKIVFYGEILEGQNLETVKENLGALFKMDNNKIDRLLSKPSVLIKKDIDFSTASKYQEVLKKAGAVCKIEPMDTEQDISGQKTAQVSTQPDENQGKYEVIFYGELEEGQNLTTVKKRLADLFNKDLSKIEEFLSHMPAIIKKNVDLDTALKYRETLKKAGAVCLIKPVKGVQTIIQVSTEPESEKIQASPSVSPSETQMYNETASHKLTGDEPASPEPIVNEQPSAEPIVNESPSPEPIENEQHSPELMVKEPSSPESKIKEEIQSESSDHLNCLQCNLKVNFFKRLFHLSKEERKEILRLIVGSAFIGAIVGFMWGGLYDPWQSKGISAAWLNSLLFGGWGFAEVAGVVVARNLRYAKGRLRLIFNGALWGGIWVSLFTALEMVKNVSSLESIFLNIVVGLSAGFIIGGLISAICAINLSGIMTLREEKKLTI